MLGEQEGAIALAGGQSLMPALNLRELAAPTLVDITRLPELRGIRRTGESVLIGAGEPMWDVERSGLVAAAAPLLIRALGTVGAPAIRSRATLGGSAAWADSTSQLPATMLALEATFVTTTRRLPARRFFELHRRSASGLLRGELIVSIEVPACPQAAYGLQHVRRTHITWPVVGCAVALRLQAGAVGRARIALYGAGERPLLAVGASDALTGASPGPDVLDAVAHTAAQAASPTSDERASAAYRRQVLPALIRRALAEAVRATS